MIVTHFMRKKDRQASSHFQMQMVVAMVIAPGKEQVTLPL
jgi:hypothetical protein